MTTMLLKNTYLSVPTTEEMILQKDPHCMSVHKEVVGVQMKKRTGEELVYALFKPFAKYIQAEIDDALEKAFEQNF